MNEGHHSVHPSPQILACVRDLKTVDFELAYLALLTREGLKPLSRWEKPLAGDATALLGRMGLLALAVPRTVRTGTQVTETVFSLLPACVRLYEQSFAEQPVDKSPKTVRLEGFLFGYPACCVEQYARQPYAPNDLPDESRRILFHWPCPNCRITPLLLPAYRKVYRIVENG